MTDREVKRNEVKQEPVFLRKTMPSPHTDSQLLLFFFFPMCVCVCVCMSMLLLLSAAEPHHDRLIRLFACLSDRITERGEEGKEK